MMTSDAPLDRHGSPIEGENEPSEHTLSDSRREFLYQIAHRRLGEWREWRRIADETGIADPLELHGRSHIDSPLIIPFELDADPSRDEDENLTDELGFDLAVHGGTGELDGEATLAITDTAVEQYELTLTAPGDSTAGVATSLSYTDLHDVEGAEATPKVTLRSAQARYYVELELDHKVFFVLWLRRKLPVYLNPDVERYVVLVPDVELPSGRGE